MNIRLHIERLVIDDIDFDPRQAKKLKSVLQADLSRRLQADGPGSVTTSRHRQIDGGSVSYGKTLKAESLGHQIGSAVFRSIRK